MAPHLDLEVIISTRGHTAQEYADAYIKGLRRLAFSLFQATQDARANPDNGREVPLWRVTLEHRGPVQLATRPIIRKTKGDVYEYGDLTPRRRVGRGEEWVWVLPAKRRTRMRFTILKRGDAGHRVMSRLTFPEPIAPGEKGDGGIYVASAVGAYGKNRSLGPSSYSTSCIILHRLLRIRLVRVRRPRNLARSSRYTGFVTVENRTPWRIKQLAGRFYGRLRTSPEIHKLQVAFEGDVAPGDRAEIECKAYLFSDLAGARVPGPALYMVKFAPHGVQ